MNDIYDELGPGWGDNELAWVLDNTHLDPVPVYQPNFKPTNPGSKEYKYMEGLISHYMSDYNEIPKYDRDIHEYDPKFKTYIDQAGMTSYIYNISEPFAKIVKKLKREELKKETEKDIIGLIDMYFYYEKKLPVSIIEVITHYKIKEVPYVIKQKNSALWDKTFKRVIKIKSKDKNYK